VLVQFCKVEEFFRKAAALGGVLIQSVLEFSILSLNRGNLLGQVRNAVVGAFILDLADKGAAGAPENDGGALILMLENLLVALYFFASLLIIAALKIQFA
jgi:uncharacterized membrane protein SpoIIM required for sporulation